MTAVILRLHCTPYMICESSMICDWGCHGSAPSRGLGRGCGLEPILSMCSAKATTRAETWHPQLADQQKEGLPICRIVYNIQYNSY